jgi:glycolate oxidase
MSGLAMPKPDEATMRRRDEIVADMRIIVPGEGVVEAANEMRVFESDGLTAYRQLPGGGAAGNDRASCQNPEIL